MFYQLLNLVEELYGRNIAYHLYFLIDAVTRRLTPEQEVIRQDQKSCEKEALNLPKNVIAHSDDTVRGAGDRDMLVLMAIAIRLLAYEFGIAVQINPVTEAERHGLTVRQVRNVKRIILKYYKARCRHGFSESPSTVMNRRDLRQNDASIHSMNMLEQLTPLLTSEQLSRVSDAFWSTLADIGEPDVDAHTQNESFDLVCGAVMMAEGDGLKADEAGHDGEHGRQVIGREHNVQPEEQRKRGQVQTEGSSHNGTQKRDLCQASPTG